MHVAGSNGKGSTCSMLESILRTAGYKTGFYLSPYVEQFQETFQVCGKVIPDEELCRITELVRDAAEQMADHPTQFEIKTAVAMKFFFDSRCDIVVLETGMGGELDSTNVIPAPEAAVITNIGLEHTEYLGNTLGEIAGAKAGIIKPGADVILYENVSEVTDVVAKKCRSCGCNLEIAGPSELVLSEHSIRGQVLEWKGQRLMLPLLGAHQRANAAVVLKTVEVLRSRGWKISDAALQEGLKTVIWPARFEVMHEEPLFILDGGHNAQCAQAMAENIRTYLPGRKFQFLTGILADKDYRAMIQCIAPYAEAFYCVTPDSPRALSAENLAAVIREMGYPAEAFAGVPEALDACLASGKDCISFGSLYISGEVRSLCRRRFRQTE